KSEWDTLYASSAYASTPLDFTWMRAWWCVYGRKLVTAELAIVTVRRAGRLVGILPLYTSSKSRVPLSLRCMRFISTGEPEYEETCPDYMNFLCAPGQET